MIQNFHNYHDKTIDIFASFSQKTLILYQLNHLIWKVGLTEIWNCKHYLLSSQLALLLSPEMTSNCFSVFKVQLLPQPHTKALFK